MGMDRFIKWDASSKHGLPTLKGLMQVAQDFLGSRWEVRATDDTWIVCECQDPMTFSLASVYPERGGSDAYSESLKKHYSESTRGFEVFFPKEGASGSVITRQADEFTCALADRYAKIITRWWHGTVEWPS